MQGSRWRSVPDPDMCRVGVGRMKALGHCDPRLLPSHLPQAAQLEASSHPGSGPPAGCFHQRKPEPG